MKRIIDSLPVLVYGWIIGFNLYTYYYASYDPCACLVNIKDMTLANEISFVGLSIALFLKSKSYYNKLSSACIAILSLLNIIAIYNPLDFATYNSLITQIVIIASVLSSVYYMIKRYGVSD